MKKILFFYYNKSGHMEVQCRKKSRDAEQSKDTGPNAIEVQVASMGESSNYQRRAKDEYPARIQ